MCQRIAADLGTGRAVGGRVSAHLARILLRALRFRRTTVLAGALTAAGGLALAVSVPADFEFTENLPRGAVATAFDRAQRDGLAMAPYFVSLARPSTDALRAAIGALYDGPAPDRSQIDEARAGDDPMNLPFPVGAGLRASEILVLADGTRARVPDRVEGQIIGFPVLVAERVVQVVTRLQMIFLVAMALLTVAFGIIFRSARVGSCALLANLLPLLAIQIAMSASPGWINMASAVAMIVASGIVVDDTIHLLWAYRRHYGSAPLQRTAAALRHTVEPISLTSLALFCGFAVSLASGLPGLQLFGALMMLTLCVAWFADMVFLPAMLVRPGRVA